MQFVPAAENLVGLPGLIPEITRSPRYKHTNEYVYIYIYIYIYISCMYVCIYIYAVCASRRKSRRPSRSDS